MIVKHTAVCVGEMLLICYKIMYFQLTLAKILALCKYSRRQKTEAKHDVRNASESDTTHFTKS